MEHDETAETVACASATLICFALPDLMRMSEDDRYEMMTDYVRTALQAYIDARGGWRGDFGPSLN